MKLVQSLYIITVIFLSQFLHANSTITPSIAGQKPANNSIWKTQGYGYILKVIDKDIRFYDITDKYCLINHTETGEYPSNNIAITTDGAELEWGALHPVKLTQLKQLPELCRQDLIQSIYDPQYEFSAYQVFDVLWYTFAEHFAFNKELNWDWNAKYPSWRKKITTQTNEASLTAIFSQLLKELGDAHAYIESKEGELIAGHNIKWEHFKKHKIEIPFTKQKELLTPYEYHIKLEKELSEIISSYFIKDVKSQRLSRSFLFGELPNKLSYLSIDDMSDFTEIESVSADLAATDKVMSHILPVLRNSKGLIIDLRWNSGGYDVVSNKILSYLIDNSLNIGSKSTKLKDGFSQPKEIVVQPAIGKRYNGPIVVLTSGLTMSAGEIFVLGLAAREQVTIIGEATNGGLSDTLPKQLPNGWTFTLSNERYLDFNKINHEYSGYPVAQKFEYLNPQDLKEYKNSALEEAIKLLN